ncbi:hypothetical protein LP090_11185 [Moraxella bovis]|nr:hypothetical protein [Moraxella bovis]UZA42725.1 hypothetical protein LP090_11185 [Moraxella bovis]
MILDILDMDNLHNANQYGSDLYYADSIVRKILGMSNHTTYRYDHGTWSMKRSDIRSDIKYRYSNISKDVWIKIIDLTMTLKHIKSAELLSWEKNPWTFADHVIYLLSLNNFVHVDVEAQIYMAEKLVQLYQDIETDPELSSVTYGYTFEEYEEATGLSALFSSSYISRGGRTDMPFYQVVRLTLKNIQQNQNFNIVAKTILSQISL